MTGGTGVSVGNKLERFLVKNTGFRTFLKKTVNTKEQKRFPIRLTIKGRITVKKCRRNGISEKAAAALSRGASAGDGLALPEKQGWGAGAKIRPAALLAGGLLFVVLFLSVTPAAALAQGSFTLHFDTIETLVRVSSPEARIMTNIEFLTIQGRTGLQESLDGVNALLSNLGSQINVLTSANAALGTRLAALDPADPLNADLILVLDNMIKANTNMIVSLNLQKGVYEQQKVQLISQKENTSTLERSRLQSDYFVQQLTFQVEKLFFTGHRLRQQIYMLDRALYFMREQERRMRVQVELGMLPSWRYEQFQLEVRERAGQLDSLEWQRGELNRTLSLLLGQNPGTGIIYGDYPRDFQDPDPGKNLKEMLENGFALRLQELSVQDKNDALKKAEANGMDTTAYRMAELEYKNEDIKLEKLKDSASSALTRAYYNIYRKREELSRQQEKLEYTGKNLKREEIKYGLGLISKAELDGKRLELENQKAALTLAEVDLAEACRNYEYIRRGVVELP